MAASVVVSELVELASTSSFLASLSELSVLNVAAWEIARLSAVVPWLRADNALKASVVSAKVFPPADQEPSAFCLETR